ncbi:MAG: hypothetical protein COA32_05820 [Fluviicola sp.]|nr:MAG: hypothetical protein COA32_05820 [Fluviicola sp.]
MSVLNIHISLVKFGYSYDIGDTKNLIFEINEELISFLRSSSILFEKRNQSIIVEKENLPYAYFHNEVEFYNVVKKKHFEKNVVISNYKVENQSLILEDEKVYLNGKETQNFLFANALAYFEAIQFFKNCHDNDDQENFEFVDFYSEANNSIIFSSISEKRRLKLKFKPVGTIPLNTEVNYFSKFSEFKDTYTKERNHFHTFLKNAMISNIASFSGIKFEAFFYKIEKILNDAKLNFNVYLQGLSLEKIQTEYSEYKQAYFKNQNEILSKISNQVVAFPFSIAAISFSLFKLSGNDFPLLLIVLGLVGYVFYTSFLARLLMLDLQKLDKGIHHDFSNLSSQKFFDDHRKELEYFTSIKNDLIERIKKLKLGLFFFVTIVWIVSFGLVIYASKLIFKWEWSDLNARYYIFIPLGFLLLYIAIYKFLIICKKKKN